MVVSRKGKSKAEHSDPGPSKHKLLGDSKHSVDPKPRKGQCKISPASHWYTIAPSLPLKGSLPTPSQDFSSSQFSIAKTLHEAEVALYEQSEAGGQNDARFLSRVLTSGTTSDRLSALTLMAQSSPLHNTRALTSLLTTAQKKNRDESLKGLRALVDWWVGGGAPERKLKFFQDQALTHSSVSDIHRMVWFFEDWLKKFFWEILQLLERLSMDPLPYVRTQTTGFIATLLSSKPEQEQNLLRLLVNKLGDGEKSVASKASYYLLQLLQQHPNMKGIIVSEMGSLLRRPSLSGSKGGDTSGLMMASAGIKSNVQEKKRDHVLHARYYAIITFNQIMLSSSQVDREVAKLLVDLYFELFRLAITADDPTERKEGVDRDPKGRQERRKDKERSKQQHPASNGSGQFSEIKDGNEKYLSAILTGLHRALPYAAHDAGFFGQHVDTLFRFTHSSTFNISIQSLLLIFSIVSMAGRESKTVGMESKNMETRFYRSLYAALFDARLASTSKQSMFLNLLLKSMKRDQNSERLIAFIRRLLASLICGPVAGDCAFGCGALFVIGEIMKERTVLQTAVSPSKRAGEEGYDPRKREPEFSRAEGSPSWEFALLSRHFHPSIQLHAAQILSGTKVTANADLSLNTLSHFLDRFAYRNPKKPAARGSSAMQPLSEHSNSAIFHGDGARIELTMTENSFRRQNESRVPADQVFYHKYFSHIGTSTAERRRVSLDEDADSEKDEASDEEEIWKAIRSTLPDGEPSEIEEEEEESLGPVLEDEDGDEEDGDEEDGDEEDLLNILSDEEGSLLSEFSASEASGSDEPSRKRKRDQDENPGTEKRKRRIRDLPTFASYEDYSKMIEDTPEDNL